MVLLLAQENEWLTHDDAKGGRVFDLEEWVVHLEWTFRLRRWSQHGKYWDCKLAEQGNE